MFEILFLEAVGIFLCLNKKSDEFVKCGKTRNAITVTMKCQRAALKCGTNTQTKMSLANVFCLSGRPTLTTTGIAKRRKCVSLFIRK